MRHMIFGESHGPAIGVVVEGVPAGLELELEAVQRELNRRRPGQGPTATARKESDLVEVLSGVFEGKTTGAPLAMVIRNADQHSQDYEAIRYTPRPSHGDYAGFIRSQGCQDYRGGGHFSGRLTAPLVAAGAVAKQVLARHGVWVGAHISSIYGISDASLEDEESLRAVAAKSFPVLDDAKGEEMRQAILEAKNEGDSVGGAVECAVFGGGKTPVQASGVGEILAAAEFYDFEAKYYNPESRTVVNPPLPGNAAEEIRRAAVEIFRAVDGYGLSRVDFFVKEDGEVVFNEINTMPGFTAISMYPTLWEAAGMDKKTLVQALIDHAFARYDRG